MRALPAIVVALTALAAGCGGGDEEPAAATAPAETVATTVGPRVLDALDTVRVAEINLAFAEYCVAVLGGELPSPELQDQVVLGVDELIAVARRDPDAIVEVGDGGGVTMRQYLGDAASILDNGDCASDQARQLDRALDSL